MCINKLATPGVDLHRLLSGSCQLDAYIVWRVYSPFLIILPRPSLSTMHVNVNIFKSGSAMIR